MVSALVLSVDSVDNLVLLKSQTGTAQGVCAAIDDANLANVVGTLAGNDTTLVVFHSAEDAAGFVDLVRRSCRAQ
jgi:transcriptional regulator of arginine metabolism